jgi:hypothetical protein
MLTKFVADKSRPKSISTSAKITDTTATTTSTPKPQKSVDALEMARATPSTIMTLSTTDTATSEPAVHAGFYILDKKGIYLKYDVDSNDLTEMEHSFVLPGSYITATLIYDVCQKSCIHLFLIASTHSHSSIVLNSVSDILGVSLVEVYKDGYIACAVKIGIVLLKGSTSQALQISAHYMFVIFN